MKSQVAAVHFQIFYFVEAKFDTFVSQVHNLAIYQDYYCFSVVVYLFRFLQNHRPSGCSIIFMSADRGAFKLKVYFSIFAPKIRLSFTSLFHLAEVSHELWAAVTHPDLLHPYCYYSLNATNPPLPVFAFTGQETVWAGRSKSCSHLLSQIQAGWTKLQKSVYFNMQREEKLGMWRISVC